ncbi:cytochrome c maturation protein CcmE [Ahniella affigens]|uniref:Cytochrome c-type biogenesis protein CcmE n=1 Tax=Ahniella affigens TaxID=2021234 RepID=A0A2P1PQG3_9GAMM|nr:cytochrome c maturation protein CcmE [Ahniella affigens]AVP97074.1 cytochrome c maturation protein CcmE [Ahniella affigens]
MNPIRKRRLLLILAGLAALGVAAGLVLTALSENLQHFVSPTDIAEGKAPATGKRFRLGGIVLEGSVTRAQESLQNEFVVTDRFQQQKVRYDGILPDLFREGQSVVATGMMDGPVFVASEVLAKHDENYMPTEVADAIKRAKEKQAGAAINPTQGSTP